MFVIYHKDSTRIFTNPRTNKTKYDTEVGAKIARSRYSLDTDIWLIADYRVFSTLVEKQETKVNLMSGEKFTQSVNTSLCCDPSSETFWSM